MLHTKSSVRIKNLHLDSLLTLSADVQQSFDPLKVHIDGLTSKRVRRASLSADDEPGSDI
jgi:hypothetical protein